MEKIIKNGKEFLRFRIGDEFEYTSYNKLLSSSVWKNDFKKITPTLNNIIKMGYASITPTKNNIIPTYDSSTKNNHISGYISRGNFIGFGIKMSELGGFTKLIDGEVFIAKNAGIITSKSLVINEFINLFLNNYIPMYSQGTSQKMAMFSYFENNYIEIPDNYQELSKIIKRVNEYKQLSKQLSKQFKDYKLAILQEAEKAIAEYKRNKEYDKYISFRIGDEFEAISGKGSFNKMKKEGLASDEYDEENGFIYPFLSSQSSNNHIVGFSKKFNFNGSGIKVSTHGMGTAGHSIFIEGKFHLGLLAEIFINKKMQSNEYFGLYFNNFMPKNRQGTSIPVSSFSNVKNNIIEIPLNYKKISKIIKKINDWEELVNKTTNKMEKYIDGVLQLSLGGNND